MIVLSQLAFGGDTNWDVADGNWNTGANWTAGEPTASDQAYIDNGGHVNLTAAGTCDSLYMGYGAGTDSLAIDDLGNLTLQYALLGMGGDATVTHQAGLVDVSQRIFIGRNSGQVMYNMTGAAQLTSADHIMVGTFNGSTGELNIQSGADASSARGFIGYNAGAGGMVLVDGAGSSWTTIGAFGIGGSETDPGGTGTLTIDHGGMVDVGAGLKLWDAATANVTNGSLSAASVDMMGGATLNSGVSAALDLGAVTLAGAGTTWTHTADLDIQTTGNAVSLTVQNSAAMTAHGNLVVHGTGSVHLDGGALTADTIDHTHGGTFTFDAGRLSVSSFLGHLTVGAGGTLHPGQSVGTTTVSNGLEMLSGSYLAIEIDGDDSSDLLNVTGTAVINSELIVDAVGSFVPMDGDQWTVAYASGGITGSAIAPAGYAVSLSEDNTTMYLTRTAPVLLGDANNDGVVSADDFAAVQTNFGNTGAADGLLLGDANDDGVVSADDFASIQTNFGNVLAATAATTPIPEPATLMLLALSSAMAFRGRSR